MKDGEGPILEEKCRAFGKDTFEAVTFLHEEVGMAHNDIHGNSFHRNYLWLEMMITIHDVNTIYYYCFYYYYYYWQPFIDPIQKFLPLNYSFVHI